MEIKVTDRALEWFQDEMFLEKGESVRFYARYGGSSPLQEGFSLGMNKEEPMDPGVVQNKDGYTFFIEEHDLWYFKEHDLIVDYDEKMDEIAYRYEQGE
ncbi:HesB/YadR/YfhF family protein [Siminovitchia sediminis]|uniref:HesB/YadR/YfhF family protein n=1 Tax=Siminovitchia sediminis TaxID=1274353 RepID=A0ABW4KG27_9BACI